MLLQGYAGDQHRLHCKSHRFDRFGAGEVWTFSEDQSSSVEPPNELVVESCPMSSMQSWIFLTCVLSSLKTFKFVQTFSAALRAFWGVVGPKNDIFVD